MSATAFPPFRLVHDRARELARKAVDDAPDGWVARIGPPNRTLDQNALFHALVGDITKHFPEWKGEAMDADDWKALLIISHAIATREGRPRLMLSLEGHGLVQLRESSARMAKDRASSLIEYVTAWAVAHGVKIRDAA